MKNRGHAQAGVGIMSEQIQDGQSPINETTGKVIHDENKQSLDWPLIERKHQVA